MMTRRFLIPIASFGLFGCNQSSPPAVSEVTVVVAVPQPDAPVPSPAQPPKKEEPPAQPPVFPFPNDAAGKELPRVVAPRAPAPPAPERFGKSPTPRTVSNKLIAPEPFSKLTYASSPLLPAKSTGLKPM